MARKPWYRADPAMYEAVRREVQDAYPDLRFVERGLDAFLVGYYPVAEGEQVHDRYQIELQLPKESPRGLPAVREIGGRIPRAPDRHMEQDGRACVALPDAFWYDHPEGMSLVEFLNEPLRSFLASQSLIERGQPNAWPAGEWGHHANGVVEFYGHVLGTEDLAVILNYLGLLKREVVKGHWSCPCGSGEKLRKCHRPLVDELRARIPRDVAARSEQRLLEAIREALKSRPAVAAKPH